MKTLDRGGNPFNSPHRATASFTDSSGSLYRTRATFSFFIGNRFLIFIFCPFTSGILFRSWKISWDKFAARLKEAREMRENSGLVKEVTFFIDTSWSLQRQDLKIKRLSIQLGEISSVRNTLVLRKSMRIQADKVLPFPNFSSFSLSLLGRIKMFYDCRASRDFLLELRIGLRPRNLGHKTELLSNVVYGLRRRSVVQQSHPQISPR